MSNGGPAMRASPGSIESGEVVHDFPHFRSSKCGSNHHRASTGSGSEHVPVLLRPNQGRHLLPVRRELDILEVSDAFI